MGKLAIFQLIQFYSMLYGVDPKISFSVAKIESNYNAEAIGPTGDVGIFGLRPATFVRYSVEQLQDPIVNIPLGIKYLAKMQKECKHKLNYTWLICYNLGVTGASKVKHPELFPYVKKVIMVMNSENYKN